MLLSIRSLGPSCWEQRQLQCYMLPFRCTLPVCVSCSLLLVRDPLQARYKVVTSSMPGRAGQGSLQLSDTARNYAPSPSGCSCYPCSCQYKMVARGLLSLLHLTGTCRHSSPCTAAKGSGSSLLRAKASVHPGQCEQAAEESTKLAWHGMEPSMNQITNAMCVRQGMACASGSWLPSAVGSRASCLRCNTAGASVHHARQFVALCEGGLCSWRLSVRPHARAKGSSSVRASSGSRKLMERCAGERSSSRPGTCAQDVTTQHDTGLSENGRAWRQQPAGAQRRQVALVQRGLETAA